MLRITIIQGAFLPVPPRRGGAVEKIWLRLGQEFAAAGHAVTHISRRCDGLPATEEISGVRHLRVPGYEQPLSGLKLKALDLLYSLRAVRQVPTADIVVTNTFWSPLLLARHRGVYVSVERMPKGQMRFYRRAARLRANSSSVQTAILREAPAAAPRVRTIPNPLPFQTSESIAWDAKQRTILFVGRIHPEKGIELLLQAFAVARRHPALHDWRLALVGPTAAAHGGGGEAWAQALQARYADPAIGWHAPVFDIAALHRHYADATLFAYPSLAELGETFGLAPLEAMAWGAVPVVSDLSCFRDFIRDGENGHVFNHRAADPVAALAEAFVRAATQRVRAVGLAATDVRKSHSPTTIARAFLDDFASLVPSR